MKKLKIILAIFIVLALVALGFVIYCLFFKETKMPVLAYHSVFSDEKDLTGDTDMVLEKFEKQMKWLHDNGYKTLTMDEFYKWKKGEYDAPRKSVVLTFDDGTESFYKTIVPVLEKYDLNATVFVIFSRTNTPGYLTQEQIDGLKNSSVKIDVASHSYERHGQNDKREPDYNYYAEDIKKGKERCDTKYYCYPFGYTNEAYKKALKDEGYLLAFKFSPGKVASKTDDDYEVRRVPVYNSTSMLKFKLKLWSRYIV